MISPWYSGRMPADEETFPRLLQKNGYATGHCGKWHMAIDHRAFPQPEDQGFGWTESNLGVTKSMRPDRVSEFATNKANDSYRLGEDGFVTDQNTIDALTFMEEKKVQPFLLYYASWLVHTPIQTRNKALLEKYCEKLGLDFPEKDEKWMQEGQSNPMYCAMVEELDHYVGEISGYLENTEDPRWPGHTLSENTYIIFTSDNGGMEAVPGEIITDNAPLDRGKISAKEGGTRVPLIITGPGIEEGVETNVMANGLDFYPTILTLTKTEKPSGKHLDGCDLTGLLLGSPIDPNLVKRADGTVRDTMMWHFPNSVALESTLRIGDWKLIHNYDHIMNANAEEYELFQLYDTKDGKSTRMDIAEANNLAASNPERTEEMASKLTAMLTEMRASYPYLNPASKRKLPNQEKVPKVLSRKITGNQVEATYQGNGAKVVRANVIYTLNGGGRYEEWFRQPAIVKAGNVTAELPEGTTHIVINLIDENNFLVSYPDLPGGSEMKVSKRKFSELALPLEE